MTQKRKKCKLKWQSEKRDHVGEFTHGPARFPRLPRSKIALKFNFRRLKSYRAIIVLNTAPPRLPPPPRPEGRVTPLCGLYWDVPLDRIRFLVSVGYGQYDRHSISFFCPKHGQGVKPAESPLHPNIYQKSPFLLPPPPPPGVVLLCRT